MNKNTKTPKKTDLGISVIFRTTFEDGTTHYMRMNKNRGYSSSTYRSHTLSMAKQRNTEFERRFLVEQSTVKVDMVFEGTHNEAITEKKRLIRESATNIIKSKILKLKKEFTKVMNSSNSSDKLFYIDMQYGLRMGLKEKMVTYKKHPIVPSYVYLDASQVERF
jgi:DNA primase